MSKPTILVVGGAGYIGSHMVLDLLRADYSVVTLDNLSKGHRELLPGGEFVEGDLGSPADLDAVFNNYPIEAVMHFAAFSLVGESVEKPLMYYRNNVANTITLLEAMHRHGIRHFIFSSTAAVYGIPDRLPIGEDAPTLPINPYGRSKLMTEWMLRDVAASYGVPDATTDVNFRYVALRYFNVAGASLDGALGQATPEATHLIKVACEAACGKREGISIFGTDYATEDGTCIRDYIHVEDLARAHLAALDYLAEGGDSQILNCGYGQGFSVRQVLDMVAQVSGETLAVSEAPRRAGDPPALVADARRIRELLPWKPACDDLETICRTAFEWEATGLARRQRTASRVS